VSEDAVGVESLSNEVAVQPSELALVRDLQTTAETPDERGFEMAFRIDACEDRLGRTSRRLRANTGALDPAAHAPLAATVDGRLSARNGLRGAVVVYGALTAEPPDGLVDCVRRVASTRQSLPHLSLRQLAAREHLQPVDICGMGHRKTASKAELASFATIRALEDV